MLPPKDLWHLKARRLALRKYNFVLTGLVLNVFDALYGDPLVAFVALAFLDDGFLLLAWFDSLSVLEGGGGREGAACRC
jgi:hypothetical protein